MLSTLFQILTDAMYLVPFQVKRFKAREPDAQVIAAGATKARRFGSASEIRAEPGWITSRRGALILTTEKLVVGSWTIPLATITSATLVRIKMLFAESLVLKVSTDSGRHYQFGLQYNPTWEKQTALPLAIEDDKLKYSVFSIVLRIGVVILLGWLLIRWLF
jgi:hypothetical protein